MLFNRNNITNASMLINSDSLVLKEQSLLLAKTIMCLNENAPCNNCLQCQKIEHNNNVDVLIYPKEKSAIIVEEMLEIVESVLLTPYEHDKKVYILNNFSSTNIQAQNKLLKTLEEMPNNVYFILNVENETKVLPTIKSRCNKIYVPNKNNNDLYDSLKEFNLTVDEKNEIVAFCNHSQQNAFDYAQNETFFPLLNFVFDLWTNLRNSSQILKYSSKLYQIKSEFMTFLRLYSLILHNVFYAKIGKLDMISEPDKIELYKILSKDFSIKSLINISKYCIKVNQKLDSNCNHNMVVDNFLLTILQERARWQQ